MKASQLQSDHLAGKYNNKITGRPSSVISVPASSIRAGLSSNTLWPCSACAASAGAPMPVGDQRINNADYLFKYHIICVQWS